MVGACRESRWGFERPQKDYGGRVVSTPWTPDPLRSSERVKCPVFRSPGVSSGRPRGKGVVSGHPVGVGTSRACTCVHVCIHVCAVWDDKGVGQEVSTSHPCPSFPSVLPLPFVGRTPSSSFVLPPVGDGGDLVTEGAAGTHLRSRKGSLTLGGSHSGQKG